MHTTKCFAYYFSYYSSVSVAPRFFYYQLGLLTALHVLIDPRERLPPFRHYNRNFYRRPLRHSSANSSHFRILNLDTYIPDTRQPRNCDCTEAHTQRTFTKERPTPRTMAETQSTHLEKTRDGTSDSELKAMKDLGTGEQNLLPVSPKETEERVQKRQGRADDPPQLVAETKGVVYPEIEPTSPRGVPLGSFHYEIERMSKDADAILDSIRNEVAGSPKVMDRVVERIDRKEAMNKVDDDDDDDDWDDDMSQELDRLGSASEEIRQAELDFMRELIDVKNSDEKESYNENELPPHSEAEERENETPLQTPYPEIETKAREKVAEKDIEALRQKPLKQPSQKSEQKSLQKLPQKSPQKSLQKPLQQQQPLQKPQQKLLQKPPQKPQQQALQKPPTQTKEQIDPTLRAGVALVWFVIMIHALSAFRNGILDAKGGLVLPFSLSV
jgi:hypothetical protein